MSDDVLDLAALNARIAALRRLLAHDHRDEPFWANLGFTAGEAQQQRHRLRRIANLMHVERAMLRLRIHSTQFATLEAQRAWLDGAS